MKYIKYYTWFIPLCKLIMIIFCTEAYYHKFQFCYFVCFSRHSGRESPCVLFHIPDGSTAGMMNQSKDKKTTGGSNSSSTARVSKDINCLEF